MKALSRMAAITALLAHLAPISVGDVADQGSREPRAADSVFSTSFLHGACTTVLSLSVARVISSHLEASALVQVRCPNGEHEFRDVYWASGRTDASNGIVQANVWRFFSSRIIESQADLMPLMEAASQVIENESLKPSESFSELSEDMKDQLYRDGLLRVTSVSLSASQPAQTDRYVLTFSMGNGSRVRLHVNLDGTDAEWAQVVAQ